MSHSVFMSRALELAREAQVAGEVPVGALITLNNEIIAEGWNRPISGRDPTAHAEIVAMREAARKLGSYRLLDTTLYVTLEPCVMCAGAIVHARVKQVVYGALDPRAGAVDSIFDVFRNPKLNHRVDHYGGVMAEQCGALLKEFFGAKR